MFEAAEAALKRELSEELEDTVILVRPLWFVQSFFAEQVCRVSYHELCLYWLCELPYSDRIKGTTSFEHWENGNKYEYKWVPLDSLSNFPLYPSFLKYEVHNLPHSLRIMLEGEIAEHIEI